MKRLVLGLAVILVPSVGFAMDVSSTSISGGVFDQASACADLGGQDISPQMTVLDAPEGTTHFVIILDDPDAQPLDGKTWVHWNVVNIEGEILDLQAGEMPPGEHLQNDNEDDAYAGMCPTDGRHIYRIVVFALDAPIDINPEDPPMALTVEAFNADYGAQILATAELKAAFP